MSATITLKSTEEWVGVFWSAGKARGGAFDFGNNRDQIDVVRQLCQAHWDTEAFEGDDSWCLSLTGHELWDHLARKVWTFGEFGGTFEVGSGQMSTFLGL